FMVQVEDNGCGISKKDINNIFKPFYSNKPGGLGLGLATTYDILRANHVNVDIDSIEGEGTRFTLVFERDLSL
ncbi:MAG: ATP-binding protein, partial [Ferruginibacter sp.]